MIFFDRVVTICPALRVKLFICERRTIKDLASLRDLKMISEIENRSSALKFSPHLSLTPIEWRSLLKSSTPGDVPEAEAASTSS